VEEDDDALGDGGGRGHRRLQVGAAV